MNIRLIGRHKNWNIRLFMFNIAKLISSLFSDSIIDDVQETITSRINLVQANTRIIDRYNNWNVFQKIYFFQNAES